MLCPSTFFGSSFMLKFACSSLPACLRLRLPFFSSIWRRPPSTSQIHGAKWLKTKRLAQGMEQNHHSHRSFKKRRTSNTNAWPTKRRSLCELVRHQWKVQKKLSRQETPNSVKLKTKCNVCVTTLCEHSICDHSMLTLYMSTLCVTTLCEHSIWEHSICEHSMCDHSM